VRAELLETRIVYRLTEMDLMKSRDLADELVKSHAFRINADLEKYRQDPESDELVDDIAHYANLEIDYVWAFTLWRMQAVFEGIIAQSFLPSENEQARGLSARLKGVRKAGFKLNPNDQQALLKWGTLRNRLSHQPEWYYHAVRITRDDIEEYLTLILRILNDWKGGGEFLPYAPEFALSPNTR
jgi:hypothetical protein